MVKAHEDAAMTAESHTPATSTTTTSTITTTTINTTITTTSPSSSAAKHHQHHRHHHHHHAHFHVPATVGLQSFPHFHHWTYPNSTGSSSSSSPGVATFHFGPGFEPQPQQFVAAAAAVGALAPQHIVHFHVNPGITVSFQMGDNIQVIKGPVTVPMVSTNSSPPIAMPVQVPPGHVVQQIVDESGTLRHVILSPQQIPMQPHYGHGNGSNQPPQPYFNPQRIPPGYPPPHFAHPNPLHMGHVPPPNHQGHSPPPHNYHKDERTHRQYVKLKKKLEQKQMRGDGLSINSPQGTPPISPRKELVNGLRRSKERGMSSVGTSEDGDESTSMPDEEDEVTLITDMLSTITVPSVSEVSSRCALLHWSPPDRLTEPDGTKTPELEVAESDLRYEVLLSDRGKDGKYKSIYNGISLSCRIQDLKPGTEYSACVQVRLDELKGSASDPRSFTTPPCEPDQPQPPKLISRTRSSLQLRWNAAVDNGSHIAQYVLEYDEGKGGDFVEVYKNRGKQHNVMKLQQATSYKFRLAAINDCGKSNYSDVVTYSTAGSPPSPPLAPVLKEATPHSLHLAWQRRPSDEEFTLQMDDRESGHGFLPVYNGKELHYVCDRLRRHTDFKFRLRAANDEGQSRWCDEVSYRTLPERPAQPPRPGVKGRIHSQSFRVKWEPPTDRGGSNITNYVLELNSGNGFEVVYTGGETEFLCDRLRPGSTYSVRVSCASTGGRSDFSEPYSVTTEAVCPGRCAQPRVNAKPRANSIALRWAYPEYDGGAPVTEFEIDLVSAADQTQRQAYRGGATETVVADLAPGQTYVFLVRASNRMGAGLWSEPLEVCSGAAAPLVPGVPQTMCRGPHQVLLQWQEPATNGAPITEYRLEASATNTADSFTMIYHGTGTSYEARGLTAASTYYYRLQACNSAGWSGYSQLSEVTTPPSSPAAVALPRYTATPTSLSLAWVEPADNGSPILRYNVDMGDWMVNSDEPHCQLDRLQPNTTYRIRVQAANAVGVGSFSPALKATTPPLPPAPPVLECGAVGHASLKLKWGDGKNTNFTRYIVEMKNPKTDEFQVVYQGTSHVCKVNRLHELTSYSFRVMAASDAGDGDYSEEFYFETCIAPPPSLKAPRISEVTKRSCVVEWNVSKPMSGDPIIYQVQVTRVRDQEYKQVYRGAETRAVLQELEAGAEYLVRVCPVRQASSGDLPGAYSPPTALATESPDPAHTTTTKHHAQVVEKKPMSDQQYAMLIALGFVAFAVIVAAVMHQVFM